jgi:hypothetical protein
MTDSFRKVWTGLGALLFACIVAGAHGCARSPTAPEGDDGRICYWVNGTLHCVED